MSLLRNSFLKLSFTVILKPLALMQMTLKQMTLKQMTLKQCELYLKKVVSQLSRLINSLSLRNALTSPTTKTRCKSDDFVKLA